MKPFLERLKDEILIFDGAMGTMLYEKGIFINACYDSVNLTNPALVQGIHEAYIRAGVDVVETNTFGANSIKLGAYGLAAQMEEMNARAVDLVKNARATAGREGNCFIAGSIGPITAPGQLWQRRFEESAGAAYAEQARILSENGVDLIILETFVHIEELLFAAERVKSVCALPVAGSIVPLEPQDEDALAATIGKLEKISACPHIEVAGINCGIGPASAAELLERARPHVTKPFLVMPNAGTPRLVDGRTMYMNSPEYFSSYAKRFRRLGADAVGGCCGTTPEQLAEAARGLKVEKAISRRGLTVSVKAGVREQTAVPPAQKSKLGAKLAAGQTVAIVELVPPRSCDLGPVIEKAALCAKNGVDAVNLPDGPRASSRISSLITAVEIERNAKIETILHYCCRDRNVISMQSDLLGAYTAGLRNILAITGDPPKLGEYPSATGVFDVDAVGLCQAIRSLNHGIDLAGNALPQPTAIVIGVGLNPCALSPEYELRHYGDKVKAGAEFVITQPVFNPEALLSFLDAAEVEWGKLPVIAGVWPLTSYKNAEFMQNEVPGVEIPQEIMDRMARAVGKEEGAACGIQIAREMIRAIRSRVAGFQVSAPFGRVELALEILTEP
ncbi:MAG: bifunctional homocysteine S-methyltransferase/methylenetetrahydrofolate reductase [Treponema sp.]|jgi:homocysteine S-methyltransferase|nr:bifunctional homocysteine S-methyltransferase/methylenetetrahydrofolate reductase [Treponema sp.]